MTWASDGIAFSWRGRNLAANQFSTARKIRLLPGLCEKQRRVFHNVPTHTACRIGYAPLVMNIRSTLETRGAR
jgi:hypothetical protein